MVNKGEKMTANKIAKAQGTDREVKKPLAEAWRDFLRNKDYLIMQSEIPLSDTDEYLDELLEEFAREMGRDVDKTSNLMLSNARVLETRDAFFVQVKENGVNVV